MEFSESRVIRLPNGSNLTVDMTREFLSKIREHFKLAEEDNVLDDHVRMFLFGSLKSALDKVK